MSDFLYTCNVQVIFRFAIRLSFCVVVANKYLQLISGVLGSDVAKLSVQLQAYLVTQLQYDGVYTSDFLLTLFTLIQKVNLITPVITLLQILVFRGKLLLVHL